MIRQNSFYPVFVPTPPQNSKKKQVTLQNMREGDWVCDQCGNLNFSFRNECNRCPLQQKNNKKKPLKKPNNRKALQELTNLDLSNSEQSTPPRKENLFKSGFESLILITPKKLDKQERKNSNVSVGKNCEGYLQEYENHKIIQDVSEFSINEENIDSSFQLDQGVAYCIMLLGIDE